MYFKDSLNKENTLASKDNEVTIRFARLLDTLHNQKRKGGYNDVFRAQRIKDAIG